MLRRSSISRLARIFFIALAIAPLAVPSLLLAQQWHFVAPMHHRRTEHQSVVLQSGKILVIGGYDGVSALRSCETYDPHTDTWTEVAPLVNARFRTHAFVLSDGKVFVAGGMMAMGTNPGTLTAATCEIYDPVADTWRSTASMSVPRESFSACLIGKDRIAVFDGLDGNTGNYPSSSEVYDYSTETFSPLPPSLYAQYGAGGVYVPSTNSVVLPGGLQLGFGGYILSSAQKLDLTTNRWSLLDSLPDRINEYYGTILNPFSQEVMMFGGGTTYKWDYTGRSVALDPVTGHWSTVGYIEPCNGSLTTQTGDSILVTGGISHDLAGTPSLHNEAWWYNEHTRKITKAPTLLDSLYEESSVVIDPGPEAPCRTKTVYLIGGRNQPNAWTDHVEVLDVMPSKVLAMLADTLDVSITQCGWFDTTLEVTNLSCETLEVSSRSEDKEISVATSDTLQEIPNGAKAKLHIRILPGDSAKTKHLDLHLSAGTAEIDTLIKVHVRIVPGDSTMLFPHNQVYFASSCATLDTTLTFTNSSCVSESVQHVRSSGSWLICSPDRIDVPAGGSAAMRLVSNPESCGNYRDTIRYTIAQYGHSVDTALIVDMSVPALPTNVVVGAPALLSTSTCSAEIDTLISFTNPGCQTVYVSGLGSNGDDALRWDTSAFVLSAGESTGRLLEYSAVKSGIRTLHLSYTLTGCDGSPTKKDIPLELNVREGPHFFAQTFLPDISTNDIGSVVELPLRLLSNFDTVRSLDAALSYNTDVLSYVSYSTTGTMLEPVAYVDIKERSGILHIRQPLPFRVNDTLPLIRLYFTTFLSNADRSAIAVDYMNLGLPAALTSDCETQSIDTAQIVVSAACSNIIRAYLLNGTMPNFSAIADDKGTINLRFAKPVDRLVEVMDMLGRTRAKSIDSGTKSEFRDLPAGSYYVKVSTGGRTALRRVTVLR